MRALLSSPTLLGRLILCLVTNLPWVYEHSRVLVHSLLRDDIGDVLAQALE